MKIYKSKKQTLLNYLSFMFIKNTRKLDEINQNLNIHKNSINGIEHDMVGLQSNIADL